MSMTSNTVFAEFEDYAASIEDTDVQMTLTNLQRRRWGLTQVQAGELHMQTATLGGGYVAEGAVDRGGWAFYLNSSRFPERANGAWLSNKDVFVLPPGSEYCFISQKAQDWDAIFISSQALFPMPELKIVDARSVAQIVAPDRTVTGRLRSMLRRFAASAILEPTTLTERACVASFSEEVTNLARRILRVADTVQPDRRLVRHHTLFAQATRLIEDCPDMSLTIGELAKALNVSARSMQLAFAEYSGISPGRYLNLRRNTRAHEMLLDAEPGETTVRATAAKVGVWDFGRFAARYRELFNELPSETLARRRTRN